MRSNTCCQRAKSKAILKTISEIEQRLMIEVERGKTPIESRNNLIAVLEEGFDPEKCKDYYFDGESCSYKKFYED